jgi:hypothetical protein
MESLLAFVGMSTGRQHSPSTASKSVLNGCSCSSYPLVIRSSIDDCLLFTPLTATIEQQRSTVQIEGKSAAEVIRAPQQPCNALSEKLQRTDAVLSTNNLQSN